MNGIQLTEYGNPDVLQYATLPDPVPGAGEVLVRLRAIGVNFIDCYQRSGLYQVPLPYVPGIEGAGEVVACGAGVTGLALGSHVAFCSVPGAYAELVKLPADRTIPLPAEVSFEDAASLMLQGLTAHYLASTTYPLGAGDTCLIHAAAGGVGLLLIQIAKHRGARVIGTVSTEQKAALAREAGADEVILYTKTDFATEVLRLTGNKGAEVVYDSVGASTFEGSLKCLARRGYLVSFGQASGPVPPMALSVLSEKSLFLTRPRLFDYVADRSSLIERASEVFELYRTKKLKLTPPTRFALEEASTAHRALEGRKTTGKVLLIPGG